MIPPLAQAGATLGGSVAAATSGANAFRHGGVRDFVIGVRLIDGTGRLVAGGGKVVKNAAGFDLPKLMVGSRGRLGVITQLSFKVFPSPAATVTHRYELGGLDAALATIAQLCRGPIMLDAVDVDLEDALVVRLGGDADVLTARSRRLQAEVGGVAEVLADGDDHAYWADVASFAWVPDRCAVIRVPVPAALAPRLRAALSSAAAPVRLSLAANLAWVAWPSARPIDELSATLRGLRLTGVALTGEPLPGLLGAVPGGEFARRVRSALDPFDRFVED